MSERPEFEYSVDQNDFLTYYLFTASQSKEFKKKVLRGRLIAGISFLLLALVLYQKTEIAVSIYFLVMSGISFAFYPQYLKWLYHKNYKNHIEENLSNRFGKNVKLWFDEEYIYTEDSTGEGKLKISEVTQIDELGYHLFVRLSTGQSIIIPKSKIDSIENIRSSFKDLNLEIVDQSSWKW